MSNKNGWQTFAARALDIAERAVAVMEAREVRIGSGLAFEREEEGGSRTRYRDGKVTRHREEPAWMPRNENKGRTGAGDVPGDIA